MCPQLLPVLGEGGHCGPGGPLWTSGAPCPHGWTGCCPPTPLWGQTPPPLPRASLGSINQLGGQSWGGGTGDTGGCGEPHDSSGATAPPPGTFTAEPQPCPSLTGSWGAAEGGCGVKDLKILTMGSPHPQPGGSWAQLSLRDTGGGVCVCV